MINIPLNTVFSYVIILLVILTQGCRDINGTKPKNVPSKPKTSAWFRQSIVDLGARIQMLNTNSGFASSRGRGQDVAGKVYRFSNGKWIPILSYPYSDSPLISATDSNTVTIVHHLIHTGYCKPIMKQWQSGKIKEIRLPRIMWDKTDFAIFNGLTAHNNKPLCMVGQQGHILMADGLTWKETNSPLLTSEKSNMYEGDLNDVAMTSSKNGWAVGRGGLILHYTDGKWIKYNSPTQNDLNKISFADEQHGWIVGDKGTVLEFYNNTWQVLQFFAQQKFLSVKSVDSNHVWIVSANSTLIFYDGKKWETDITIKAYEDDFADIDIVKDTAGVFNIWIIGNNGIYTNSQSLGFSFTDITSQAALRRTGKGGIFFNRTNNDLPDVLIIGDDGPNLLFCNNGHNVFSESTLESDFGKDVFIAQSTSIGDINNDGSLDVLELSNNIYFRLLFGSSNGRFRNGAEFAKFIFDENSFTSTTAIRLVDFDNDGNLDVYFSNENNKDNIFRNDGTGKFVSVYDSAGIDKLLNHKSLGATFGDFNNDGLIDILIPYYISEKNKFLDLYINEGNFKFHLSTDSSFFSSENVAVTVCIAADFNNDGNIDIAVHNQGAKPWILLNNGNAHFRKYSSELGFTAPIFQPDPTNGTIAAGDINNDGWIDLFIASKVFLNNNGKVFTEVSEQTGIQFTGHPSFADFDNDGDLDLFIGSSQNSLGKGERAVLYRNNLNDNNFIKVRVHGDLSNRSAVGAKVFLVNPQQPLQKQTRVVGIGSNPMIVQDVAEIFFGAPAEQTYNLTVQFPSGVIQQIEEVKAGSILDVYESSALHRIAILTTKSLERTIKMIDWVSESIKLVIVIILIASMILLGIKIGAGKFTRTIFYPIACLLLYLLCRHITIMYGNWNSTFISFGAFLFFGIASTVSARFVIQKLEARYISHYKLIELLGQGGMGRAFKAIDINNKQTVAIKILSSEILKDTENKKRLLSEGQLLSSFSHPNIIKVFEVADSNSGGFIAMEYLPGGTLRQLLEQSYPLPFIEVEKILIQVCDGLKEVHQHGIIHRDLKSGNIMFDADRNIRIMDFGLSKSPLVTTMTSLGTVLGTLGYVAPEQITNQNVDQRTDIFSLGVIIYEMLTNTLPFKGENEIALIHSIFNVIPPPPSSLRKDIPDKWDLITLKCLSKNPAERYSSAGEIKEAILK